MNRSDEKKLLSTFNKFSGRPVLHPLAMGICRTSKEIDAEAKKIGLSTRILYPGQQVTMDYCETRLNVHVAEKRGQYSVAKFDLG